MRTAIFFGCMMIASAINDPILLENSTIEIIGAICVIADLFVTVVKIFKD